MTKAEQIKLFATDDLSFQFYALNKINCLLQSIRNPSAIYYDSIYAFPLISICTFPFNYFRFSYRCALYAAFISVHFHLKKVKPFIITFFIPVSVSLNRKFDSMKQMCVTNIEIYAFPLNYFFSHLKMVKVFENISKVHIEM